MRKYLKRKIVEYSLCASDGYLVEFISGSSWD